jgi:hypothetical protein
MWKLDRFRQQWQGNSRYPHRDSHGLHGRYECPVRIVANAGGMVIADCATTTTRDRYRRVQWQFPSPAACDRE